jgi:hypothetical protein
MDKPQNPGKNGHKTQNKDKLFIEIYCVWYWILTIQVIPNWVCFISPLIITLDKSYKWLIVIAYLCPFVADVIMHTNMSLNTCSRTILTVKAVHGGPYLHNHSQECTKHRTKTNNIELVSAVLTHGHAGQLPRGPTSIAVYANLCENVNGR